MLAKVYHLTTPEAEAGGLSLNPARLHSETKNIEKKEIKISYPKTKYIIVE
jgi:hypothetical protein